GAPDALLTYRRRAGRAPAMEPAAIWRRGRRGLRMGTRRDRHETQVRDGPEPDAGAQTRWRGAQPRFDLRRGGGRGGGLGAGREIPRRMPSGAYPLWMGAQ